MIENQNFMMVAGDYKEITVPVTDAAGANKDLTGSSIVWVVKANPNDTTPLVSKSTASGITILAAPNAHKFKITLVEADTLNVAPGVHYHEARVTDPLSHPETVMRGRVVIKKKRT